MELAPSSLTEVNQFSTAILQAPIDDHIGRNIECTIEVENNLISKNVNFRILTHVCMRDGESEVEIIEVQQDAALKYN
jgi:hypothetical protein